MTESKRVLKPTGEIYLTLLSKSSPSFTDPRSKVIDGNTRLKMEEDGSVLPHYYVGQTDIEELLSGFSIIRIRQIQDIYAGGSSWHYFVHARAGD